MKTVFTIVALVICLCGCRPAQNNPAARTRWEYKTVEYENYADADTVPMIQTNLDLYQEHRTMAGGFGFESPASFPKVNLSDLGRDGWELVSAVSQVETMEDAGTRIRFNNIRTGKVTLIFKRPIQ